MKCFWKDIYDHLQSKGFDCLCRNVCGRTAIDITLPGRGTRTVLPLEISATSEEAAIRQSVLNSECVEYLRSDDSSEDRARENSRTIIVTEDRWHSQQEMMKARLLAHLEVFDQIYARNCEVRKIDKQTAAEFLAANHSYGNASCRYRYGLFLKRHTGHVAAGGIETVKYQKGTLVAVATFSNARKWIKGDKTIRSYEWTRYASLPGVRLSGGMGKLLKAFIEDVHPDDIMTYADLEWSEGKVYERLGFVLEGVKAPVTFSVDTASWDRHAVKEQDMTNESVYFRNFGSNKYRLKLTDYQ